MQRASARNDAPEGAAPNLMKLPFGAASLTIYSGGKSTDIVQTTAGLPVMERFFW